MDDSVLDGSDPFAIIEPVWATLDVYSDDAEYSHSARGLTRGQRYLVALQAYRAELTDGGHGRFFYNVSGVLVRDALAALAAIGVPDGAAILLDATKRVGGPALTQQERRRRLDADAPSLGDLDGAFWKVDEGAFIDQHILAFARSHRPEFYFKGPVKRSFDVYVPTK